MLSTAAAALDAREDAMRRLERIQARLFGGSVGPALQDVEPAMCVLHGAHQLFETRRRIH